MRKRKGINQEKLAELINVDPTTISNIENGKNYPSMINLENLLAVLDSSFLDAFDFEQSARLLIERDEEIRKYYNQRENSSLDFLIIL